MAVWSGDLPSPLMAIFIFSSETAGLIEIKLHVELLLDGEMKVCTQDVSHDQDGCHAHIL